MMEITVQGMNCGHCSRAVTNAVHSVDPDANVDVNLETKRVAIGSSADLDTITASIVAAGYEVGRP